MAFTVTVYSLACVATVFLVRLCMVGTSMTLAHLGPWWPLGLNILQMAPQVYALVSALSYD